MIGGNLYPFLHFQVRGQGGSGERSVVRRLSGGQALDMPENVFTKGYYRITAGDTGSEREN